MIAERSRDPDDPGPKALTKLSEVGIHNTAEPDAPDVGASFATYTHFVALPSLRSLYGKNVKGYGDDCFSFPYGDSMSGITHLHLRNSTIHVTNLETLFRALSGLKHFVYHYYPGLNDCGMNAYQIIKNLEKFKEEPRNSQAHRVRFFATPGAERYVGIWLNEEIRSLETSSR